MDLCSYSQFIVDIVVFHVSIDGDPKTALENLVLQYQRLFGKASVEVSKEAIKRSNIIFGSVDLPTILN